MRSPVYLILTLALFAWRDPKHGNPQHSHSTTVQSRPGKFVPDAAAPIVDSVRVLCLYGSIPAKGWQGKEPMHGPNSMLGRMVKLHGGHVAIEYAHDKALSFQPVHYDGVGGAGHLMPRSDAKNFNSCFRIYTEKRAWNVLGNYYNNLDSLRRAVFVIPVTAAQKHTLDSLATVYTQRTPYDYAFFGMRCASASYEFLLEAGLVAEYRHHIWRNVFTTRDFRNALYKDYERNRTKGWRLETSHGSLSRQWEKDSQPLMP
jgi:hypothetical protein